MLKHNCVVRTEMSGPSKSEPIAMGSEAISNGQTQERGGRHVTRWIATIAGLLAAIFVVAMSVSPQSTHAEVYSPLVGHQSPAVTGTYFTQSAFDLGPQRGHFVVVDFSASWCVPCRTEQPHSLKFAEEQRNGATFVGVNFLDIVTGLRSFLGPWKGLYPVTIDPGRRLALNFGAPNPSFKYVIDAKGIVVAKIIGPGTAGELDSIASRALAQDQ